MDAAPVHRLPARPERRPPATIPVTVRDSIVGVLASVKRTAGPGWRNGRRWGLKIPPDQFAASCTTTQHSENRLCLCTFAAFAPRSAAHRGEGKRKPNRHHYRHQRDGTCSRKDGPPTEKRPYARRRIAPRASSARRGAFCATARPLEALLCYGRFCVSTLSHQIR